MLFLCHLPVPHSLNLITTNPPTQLQYDAILAEVTTAPTSDQRNDALRSLGRARSPALIERTLTLPLSPSVKSQDVYLPLGGLRTHAAGVLATWEWLTGNWATLQRKLPPGLTMLGTVVSICVGGFSHKDQADMVKGFFADQSTKGFEMSLRQSLDAVKAKAGWVARDGADVRAWLGERGFLGGKI